MANKTKAELLNIIGSLRRTMDDVQASRAEKDNQIKQLQADAEYDAKESDKKDNVIKHLRGLLEVADTSVVYYRNDYKQLDNNYKLTLERYAELGDECNEKDKEIKDLEQELSEMKEKRRDSARFHNATEAMGNPLYFHRVSND